MYGRVNKYYIPFDIVANGANLNKAAQPMSDEAEVAKNLLRNFSQNKEPNMLQKMRMEIKTQLSNPYVITGSCRRSYDDK